MRTLAALAALVMLGFAGCSGEDPFDVGSTRSAAPEAMGISTDTVESVGPKEKKDTPAPAPKPERKKAEAGATGRGDYGGGFGTTALSTYVRVQEKAGYSQVEQALNLYKASNGELPKSQEEFDEKIIKPNNIVLPKLAPGMKHVYDPEKGELMIEKEVEKK